jgi:transcriptional regulator with PAS, ATPase and Fis domain
LNVFPLFIPPLRERKKDLKPLISHIIRKFNQEYGRSVSGITDEAFNLLSSYKWPGNVRELENLIGRAMIYMNLDEDLIKLRHLPPLGEEIKSDKGKELQIDANYSLEDKNLKKVMNNYEKKIIKDVLNRTDGNRTEAAGILGIAIRSLYYKINKYEID